MRSWTPRETSPCLGGQELPFEGLGFRGLGFRVRVFCATQVLGLYVIWLLGGG